MTPAGARLRSAEHVELALQAACEALPSRVTVCNIFWTRKAGPAAGRGSVQLQLHVARGRGRLSLPRAMMMMMRGFLATAQPRCLSKFKDCVHHNGRALDYQLIGAACAAAAGLSGPAAQLGCLPATEVCSFDTQVHTQLHLQGLLRRYEWMRLRSEL